MKNLLASSILVFSSLLASTALADVSYSMPATEGGFKWYSADLKNADSNKQVAAFQFGGSVVINIAERFGLKTGLFYSERTFKSEFGASTIDGKITYADIPVFFMYKLEDYAGLYVGPSIAMKIGDECKGCTGGLRGVKSSIVPITIGGQFKFAEKLGLNIFFETVAGGLANDIDSSRGIGVNLLFAFN